MQGIYRLTRSLAAPLGLALLFAGCAKNLTQAERDEWRSRTDQTCRCVSHECMATTPTVDPPPLKYGLSEYTPADQEFLRAASQRASGCIRQRLRSAEAAGQ